VDHHTYVFLGDGCLMEGVSHEACSLAGTQGLGKLIGVYDDNGISIDGKVQGWFTDDTPARFEAYGWHVVRDVDGHDPAAVKRALEEARSVTDRPSLICAKTVIGFGAPNVCGTHGVHGAPLGDEEIAATREFLGWEYGPFEVPEDIYAAWDARQRGTKAESEWQQVLEAYREAHPDLAREFERRIRGDLPGSFDDLAERLLAQADEKAETQASRKASQIVLNGFGPHLPELIGGSADLTGSNNTWWDDCAAVSADDADGNYIFYGVREFGMTAVANGMSLHGGFVPYVGTFLVFSDYARNAVRMAALMKARNILVYTHDSIGLGEDGPTHQPVEHVATLRLIPNMSLWRPCDVVETVAAWQSALERRDGPTALCLSRQKLPHQERTEAQLGNVRRGGYVLRDCDGEPEAIIIATGSEVGMAAEAWAKLSGEGRRVRLVSMPSVDVFEQQDADYRESVLPAAVKSRVAVEAGVPDYWWRYVGPEGAVLGLSTFGESAPGPEVYRHFGLTADGVVAAVKSTL
jgi:transketolase